MVSVLIISNQAPSPVMDNRPENMFEWWSQKLKKKRDRQCIFLVVCLRETFSQHRTGNLVFPCSRIMGFAMFDAF